MSDAKNSGPETKLKRGNSDIRWSRYNTLFRSARFGAFVYNSLSNTLVELDNAHYRMLNEVKRGNEGPSSLDHEPDFVELLRKKLFLASDQEEENGLLTLRYQRLARAFGTDALALSVCPTLDCNFRCPYCFESTQQAGHFMSKETQQRLIDWVRNYKGIDRISVNWYGGEPLLAFNILCDLTEKFRALDLKYSAGLVTNGYLLTEEKIKRLNDLGIFKIQITLDGPRDIHDSRRFLEGGIPTFDRIMDNINCLMESDYKGRCDIRVNVDKCNHEKYLELYNDIMKQFKGKNLSIHPGYVDTTQDHAYGQKVCLSNDERIDFDLEIYNKHGEFPTTGIYPDPFVAGMCVAVNRNGFVMGPEGELYKCWKDVGVKEMVVGNIHCENYITNPVLLAQYGVGMDGYSDPECKNCLELPLCSGECVYKRLQRKLYGETGLQPCTLLKGHLPETLEVYIETIRSREICSAMLGKAQPGATQYRDISPERISGKTPSQQH